MRMPQPLTCAFVNGRGCWPSMPARMNATICSGSHSATWSALMTPPPLLFICGKRVVKRVLSTDDTSSPYSAMRRPEASHPAYLSGLSMPVHARPGGVTTMTCGCAFAMPCTSSAASSGWCAPTHG